MKPNFRTQLERNLLNIAHTGLLSSNSAGQYGHHFQTFPGEPSVFFVFVVLQDCHNSSRLLHNRADYSAYLDPISLIKIEHRAEHSRLRVSQTGDARGGVVASVRQLVLFRSLEVTGSRRFAEALQIGIMLHRQPKHVCIESHT